MREFIELGAVLMKECADTDPWTVAREAEKLCERAKTLQRLYVKQCNEPLSTAETNRMARYEQEVKSICETLGLPGVSLGGDPRGGQPVKLLLPSGRTNDFGGEGYAVPLG